jgi:hypothetical protein
MSRSTLGLIAVGTVAAVAAVAALAPVARSQIQAMPSYVPIGVSSSNGVSTAWFHEPSSRQALACQTVATADAGPAAIKCVGTKLP